jgi:hypothetical protein
MIAQNDQAWDRSVTWLREALAIYRAEGAPGGEAETLFALGPISGLVGRDAQREHG